MEGGWSLLGCLIARGLGGDKGEVRVTGSRTGPGVSSCGSDSIKRLSGAKRWQACGNSGPWQRESFPHRSRFSKKGSAITTS